MASNNQIPDIGNNLRRTILLPINNPSDNSYSYEGNNLVQFALPSTLAMADFSTIRLSGSLRFTQNSAMNQDASGGEWTKIFQNPIAGVNSVFRSVEISSASGARASLEKCQNYGQMINTILPALNSQQDYVTYLQSQTLSSQNIEYGNKFFIRNASYFKSTADGGDNEAFGVRFSTPVYLGMCLGGAKIPLAQMGGCIFTFELNSSDAVFVSNQTDSVEKNRIKYELHDLKMEVEMYAPTAEERVALMNQKEGSFTCNTMTSLFSVVQSSQANVQFSLGSSDVVAAFFKFCPTNAVNSLVADEFQSTRIIDTNNKSSQFFRVRFQKNGLEFPLYFPINVVSGSTEAQLNKYYLQSLKNLHTRNDIRVATTDFTNDVRWSIGADSYPLTTANIIKGVNKANVVYGIGYSFLADLSGSDFKNQSWQVTLDSNLSDARTNAMYAFILQKTTIAFNENGVSVIN